MIITLRGAYEKIRNGELILYLHNSSQCHNSVIDRPRRWEKFILSVPTHSKQLGEENTAAQPNQPSPKGNHDFAKSKVGSLGRGANRFYKSSQVFLEKEKL